MTIWERAKAALTTLSVPLAEGVYIPASGTVRPDTYIVFSTLPTVPLQHADNEEKLRDHLVQVSIWSKNGLVNLPDVEGAMKAAGFTYVTSRELPYEDDTRYFGLAIDFDYVEDKE